MRFKRIQTALADGRLEEAFEVLSDPDLQTHRTGQKLLTQLSEAFIKRGQEHLIAQRLAQALDDCNRAQKLAGNTPAAADLRKRIGLAIEDARIQSRQKADQLARAKEQLENGMLSKGRQMLDGCEDGHARLLLKNAELDRAAADAALKRIRSAIENGDVKQAMELVRQWRLESSGHDQAPALLKEIASRGAQQIRRHLQDGRLAAAVNLLKCFNGQADRWETLYTLRQALQYCLSGARAVRTGQFAQAAVELQKALRLEPDAAWLREAVKEARQGAQACEALQTGPLGLIDPLSGPETGEADFFPEALKQSGRGKPLMSREIAEPSSDPKPVPGRLLLQMDGIGSFLVFCGPRVTVGPISGSSPADLGLVVNPEAPIKAIERIEGDYFVSEPRGASSKRLLADGDRIEITPRCRMVFTLPNPASGTAMLKPGSARLPRSDIQGILLMDREILIGPARNCHIQSGQTSRTVTLFQRGGRLFAKSETGGQEAIEIGKTVMIGPLRLVVTNYG